MKALIKFIVLRAILSASHSAQASPTFISLSSLSERDLKERDNTILLPLIS